MILNKKIFFPLSLLFVTTVVLGQTPGAVGDNALNYNRLIKEKTGDGVYKLIGTYKVVGTSYLFEL